MKSKSRFVDMKLCNGVDSSELDQALTHHNLHCPDCNVHLTSLFLCPQCGTRFEKVWDSGDQYDYHYERSRP